MRNKGLAGRIRSATAVEKVRNYGGTFVRKDALQDYGDIEFYTCHCTGTKAYDYLSSKLRNIKYFSCGEELRI